MESMKIDDSLNQSIRAADGTDAVELGVGDRSMNTGRRANGDDDNSNVNVNTDAKSNVAASARATNAPLCYDSAYLLSNRELLENRRWQRDYMVNAAGAGIAASLASTRQRRMATLRNRALRNRRQQPTTLPIPSSTTIDNWAQCENCKKWRRLPPFVETEALPDTWVCALNIWDPLHMSCNDPEETVNEIRIPSATGQIEIERDIVPGDNLSGLAASSSFFHGNVGLSLAQQLSVVLPSSKDHASKYLKNENRQEHGGDFYQVPGTSSSRQLDPSVDKGALGHLQQVNDFVIAPGPSPGVGPGYRRDVYEPEDYAGDVFKLILKDNGASGEAAGAIVGSGDSFSGSARSGKVLKASAVASADSTAKERTATRHPASNRLVVYSREANSLLASQLPHSVVLFEAAKRPLRKAKRLKEHFWTDDAPAHGQEEMVPTLTPLDSHGKIVNRISGGTRAVSNVKDEGYNADGYPDVNYKCDNKGLNDEEDYENGKSGDHKPAAEEEEDLEQKQDELDLGVGFGSDTRWPKPILQASTTTCTVPQSTRSSSASHTQPLQTQSSIAATRPALVSLFPLLSLQIPTLPTTLRQEEEPQLSHGGEEDVKQMTIDTQRTLAGDYTDPLLDVDKVQVLSNEQVLGALEALGKRAKDVVATTSSEKQTGRHCTSVNMVLEPESCEPPLMASMHIQGQPITTPGAGVLPLYANAGLVPGGSSADAPVDLDPLLQPLEKLAQPLHYYTQRTTRSDRFPTSSCGTIAELLREHEELEKQYIEGEEEIYADGEVELGTSTNSRNGNLISDPSFARDFEASQEKLDAYPALDVTSTRSKLFAPQAATRYPQQLPLDPQRRALQKLREHYAISSLGKSYFKRLRGMRPDVDYPAPDFKTLRKFAQGRDMEQLVGMLATAVILSQMMPAIHESLGRAIIITRAELVIMCMRKILAVQMNSLVVLVKWVKISWGPIIDV